MSLDSWLILLQAAEPGSRWPALIRGQNSIERILKLSRQEILRAGLGEADFKRLRLLIAHSRTLGVNGWALHPTGG